MGFLHLLVVSSIILSMIYQSVLRVLLEIFFLGGCFSFFQAALSKYSSGQDWLLIRLSRGLSGMVGIDLYGEILSGLSAL